MTRRIVFIALFLSFATTCLAASPQVVWVGGGAQVSSQDRPAVVAETMISLGSYNAQTFFLNPLIDIKHGKAGLDLGVGSRAPLFSGTMIGGVNAFLDYTNDHNHRRVGLGAELWHPQCSSHLNVYLPLSDRNGNQEALPGLDLSFGIPIPNAAFLSIWPSLFYYDGHEEDDLKGMGIALQITPVKALTFTLGARNDTPAAGRDDNEVYARLDVTIPMSRLGKELFSFTRGVYPADVNSFMDRRVVRERFIAIEKPR